MQQGQEAPAVETVESAESAESIVEGTPAETRPQVETPAPSRSTKPESSPTDPMDELQISMEKQLSSMMANVQANILRATAKSLQDTINQALAPKIQELNKLKKQFMPTKPTAPIQEVHCNVTDESTSKKSESTSANESTSNPPVRNPPRRSPPPGLSPEQGHPSSAAKSPHFFMPIGTMYEGRPELGTLCVKCFATVKSIKKARVEAGMEDNGDIDMRAIGMALAKACEIEAGTTQVQLLRYKELPPTKAANPDNVRIQGQFVLGTLTCYGNSPTKQVELLKNSVQRVIHNKGVAALQYPSYVKCFQFHINSVNCPEQRIFALIQGLPGTFFESNDHIGLDAVTNELVKQLSQSMSTANLPSHSAPP